MIDIMDLWVGVVFRVYIDHLQRISRTPLTVAVLLQAYNPREPNDLGLHTGSSSY